jgi:hypothetical protein
VGVSVKPGGGGAVLWRRNPWSGLKMILEPMTWATDGVGANEAWRKELSFGGIDWLGESSVAHLRGLGFFAGVGPGVPALESSASTAWLYAFAPIQGLQNISRSGPRLRPWLLT